MSLIHTSFRAHDKKVLYHPCMIEKVIELPPQEYASFCCRLDDDYTFIHELCDRLCEDAQGVDHALLVLCEGKDDGILVKSEGYDYARYHSYLSKARQLVQLDRHPALDEFNRRICDLVEKYTKQAVACQLDGQFHICLESIRNSSDRAYYQDDLFSEMLSERPEFELVEQIDDELYLHIAPEYLQKEDESQYFKATPEEMEVILAKHTLWLHDAGGERANFSHCLLKDMDFSGKSLDYAIFDNAKVVNCRFYNADMSHASCRGTRFHNCSMTDMAAEGVVFRNAVFRSTELDRSLLTASNFSGATFYDSSIYSCTMSQCCFDGTDFGDVPTCYANMEGASYNEEAWLDDSPAQQISM